MYSKSKQMEKTFYFISNSDNKIYNTKNVNCNVSETINGVVIEILSEEGEVIDSCDGYETIGDLMEVANGGNDNE